MAPNITVANLAAQHQEFQVKISADVTKLTADQKTEFLSMPTDIAKLQASVTLIVNNITTSKPEPSSTCVVRSGPFTPSP
ncbi:unnamed protein product [Prunus armeniaca]